VSACKSAKNELTKIKVQAECCSRAEVYGLLLFSCLHEGGVFRTEYENAARRMAEMTASVCGVFAEVVFPGRGDGKKLCSVAIPHEEQRIKARNVIFSEDISDYDVISEKLLENECCRYAFLRGAFIASGMLCDPEKECRMEFSSKKESVCSSLAQFLASLGYKCALTSRRGKSVVVLKDGESIENLLAMIGATKASMEIMGYRIQRDIRNMANRQKNCDTANVRKTVAASRIQIEAIEKIDRCIGLGALPPELAEIARIRRDNIGLSLSDLGECLSSPISRSGVNHRLRKLVEIADELKEEDTIIE